MIAYALCSEFEQWWQANGGDLETHRELALTITAGDGVTLYLVARDKLTKDHWVAGLKKVLGELSWTPEFRADVCNQLEEGKGVHTSNKLGSSPRSAEIARSIDAKLAESTCSHNIALAAHAQRQQRQQRSLAGVLQRQQRLAGARYSHALLECRVCPHIYNNICMRVARVCSMYVVLLGAC